jgi:hypothetical protein
MVFSNFLLKVHSLWVWGNWFAWFRDLRWFFLVVARWFNGWLVLFETSLVVRWMKGVINSRKIHVMWDKANKIVISSRNRSFFIASGHFWWYRFQNSRTPRDIGLKFGMVIVLGKLEDLVHCFLPGGVHK